MTLAFEVAGLAGEVAAAWVRGVREEEAAGPGERLPGVAPNRDRSKVARWEGDGMGRRLEEEGEGADGMEEGVDRRVRGTVPFLACGDSGAAVPRAGDAGMLLAAMRPRPS